MKRFFIIALILLALPFSLFGEGEKVPPGSRIFVVPMRSQLSRYLVTQISQQKLPVAVVVDDKEADYVLTGSSAMKRDKWYNSVVGAKNENEWNFQLVRVKDKTVVWADQAGDRSMWFTSLKRDGPNKVASRIVRKMNKDLFPK